MKNRSQKGQAAILIVFIVGMISILIGASQIKLGSFESLRGRRSANSLQSYYAANSGIEDAVRRIENGDFTTPVNMTVGGASVKVEIKNGSTADEKLITSVAKKGLFVRRLQSKAKKKGGFRYAIQAGNGGLEMNNQTEVEGNVYSNSDVKGKNNDFAGGKCKNSSSRINGEVMAMGSIDKLSASDKGVCIEKIATASAFLNCRVNSVAYDPNTADTISSINCPHSSHAKASPVAVTMPDLDESGTFTSLPAGDCIADGSNNPSNCAGTTNTLGNVIVNGNLTIIPPANKVFYFSGPVKVSGYIKFKGFSNNNKVALTTTAASNGLFVTVAAEGKITSETGNVTFCRDNTSDCTTGNKYLLLGSKYQTTNPIMCNDPAIDLHSNTSSILFFAKRGCLAIASGGVGDTFYGAVIGEKVKLSSNVNIKYDPNLGTSTNVGSWQIQEFKEY